MALMNKDHNLLCEYSSDRMPDYKEEYAPLCNQILLEYSIWDFAFLGKAGFYDRGNNKLGSFSLCLTGFTEANFDDKWKCNLGYLFLVFQSETLKFGYEGAYNTLNFVINSIYKEIQFRCGIIYYKANLFKDIELRRELVRDNFKDIAEYLWQTRENISGARLSVGNTGLYANRNRFGTIFTDAQKSLIDAIAHGCSLPELEAKNYEGAKRLIYVPYNKI